MQLFSNTRARLAAGLTVLLVVAGVVIISGAAVAPAVITETAVLEAAPVDDSASVVDDAAPLSEAARQILAQREPDVPALPFPDNPDPTECGIPQPWGDANTQAWLTGTWEGELIQDPVLLYNSHSRLSISARGAHGAEARVIMFQSNPVLNYYFVEVTDAETGEEERGWVPAPFLSFEPVTES